MKLLWNHALAIVHERRLCSLRTKLLIAAETPRWSVCDGYLGSILHKQYQQDLHLFCMSIRVGWVTMPVSWVFYRDHKECTQNQVPIQYSLSCPSKKTTAQPAAIWVNLPFGNTGNVSCEPQKWPLHDNKCLGKFIINLQVFFIERSVSMLKDKFCSNSLWFHNRHNAQRNRTKIKSISLV